MWSSSFSRAALVAVMSVGAKMPRMTRIASVRGVGCLHVEDGILENDGANGALGGLQTPTFDRLVPTRHSRE